MDKDVSKNYIERGYFDEGDTDEQKRKTKHEDALKLRAKFWLDVKGSPQELEYAAMHVFASDLDNGLKNWIVNQLRLKSANEAELLRLREKITDNSRLGQLCRNMMVNYLKMQKHADKLGIKPLPWRAQIIEEFNDLAMYTRKEKIKIEHDTKFSEFIRTASDEEKEIVYADVMDKATDSQNEMIKASEVGTK